MSDPRRIRGDLVKAEFEPHFFLGRRLPCGRDARSPLPRRPDRSRCKAAAAVRADIEKPVLDAGRAEGAFIGTDPRVLRGWRKILVAIFAIWSELQRHWLRPARSSNVRSLQIAGVPRMTRFPRFAPMPDHGVSSFSGNLALSFKRSSTIEERTCATLGCGISTLLTMSDRLLRSRNTALST